MVLLRGEPFSRIYILRERDWTTHQPSSGKIIGERSSEGELTWVSASGFRTCSHHEIKAMAELRNIFACLVHESQECVADLIRNLRFLDPSSTILLYNGGRWPQLLDFELVRREENVVCHPSPQPMNWGRLHDFALDCMRFALENLPFDTLTIVDSDRWVYLPRKEDSGRQSWRGRMPGKTRRRLQTTCF